MNAPVATHIEIRANLAGQPRAYITGTQIRVQDIYAQAEIHGHSPEEIANQLPMLTLGQVYAALSYAFDHRQQILEELRADDAWVKELQKCHPASVMQRQRSRV